MSPSLLPGARRSCSLTALQAPRCGSCGVANRAPAARRVAALVSVACCLAFVASRCTSGQAQDSDQYRDLIAPLYVKPVTTVQLRAVRQAGIPALDAVLDDFAGSRFVRDTLHRLRKGFNVGRAIDQSVYASNVVRVAETFGVTGVRELVRRQPAALAKEAKLNSREFRKLGVGAIKPLLTIEMLRGTPNADLPGVEDWVSTFVDAGKVPESVARSGAFFGEMSKGVAADCYRLPYQYHYKAEGVENALRQEIPNSFWMEQISPAERRKIRLSPLNPGAPR